MKKALLILLLALSYMLDGAQAMKRRVCRQGGRAAARRLGGTSGTSKHRLYGARGVRSIKSRRNIGTSKPIVQRFGVHTANCGRDGYNDYDDNDMDNIGGYSDIDLEQLSQSTLDELIAAAGGIGDDNELPKKDLYFCDSNDWVGYSSSVYSLVQNLSSNLGKHNNSLFDQFGTLYELLGQCSEFQTFMTLYENLYKTDKLKFFHRIEEDFSHRSPVFVGKVEQFDTERYMNLLKKLINASKTMIIGSDKHISLLKEFTRVSAKFKMACTSYDNDSMLNGYDLTPQAIHRIALWYMTFYKINDCFRTNT